MTRTALGTSGGPRALALALARTVVGALLVALGGLGLGAGPAQAHASLVSTDPAEGEILTEAPEALSLTFDEPVSVVPGATSLFDADGGPVEVEVETRDAVVTVTPRSPLGDGTFVLAYRVVSADSHPIAGSLSFSVGAPSDVVTAPPPVRSSGDPLVRALQGVLQGLLYAGLLLAAGVTLFSVWLLPDGSFLDRVRLRLVRLVRVAATVAVAAAILLVPVAAVHRAGGTAGALVEAAGSAASWASGDALLALLVAVGLGGCVVLAMGDPARRSPRLASSAAAGVALCAPALVGHTRSYGPALTVVGSDVLHVVAAAGWLGGLVGLTVALPALAGRERVAASVLTRFSSTAAALLAAVAVTGSVLGWRILGSWSALVGTSYGLLLLVKLALVGSVVAVAAWNRLRLLPAVTEALGHGRRLAAARRLRRAVRLEAAGLVAAVLVTGFLVNQVPREEAGAASDPPARSTALTVGEQVRVVAHLEPGVVGRNVVVVQIQDLTGEPLEPEAAPQVSLRSPEVSLGARPARNVDSGTYEAEVTIPEPGAWQVRVGVRLDRFTNPVLVLEVPVPPPGSGP